MEEQPDPRVSHGMSFVSSQAFKIGLGIGHEKGSQGERIGSNSKTPQRTLFLKPRGEYQVRNIAKEGRNWRGAVDGKW